MAHEDLSREQQVEGSTDRAFGLVFAGAFLLIAGWPLFHGETPRWWALGVAVVFAIIAIWKPALLAVPNRLWFKLGLLLGKVVSPVALGILFYCVVAPIGVLARLAGKDPLRLKLDSGANSYWIPRKPPGPPPDSMINQFYEIAMEMLKELWAFMRTRKKYWLWPIFVMMALLGVLIVLAQGSAIAPFIYTLF